MPLGYAQVLLGASMIAMAVGSVLGRRSQGGERLARASSALLIGGGVGALVGTILVYGR